MYENKFHGLSSPEDLRQMWRQLKHDDDSQDINVIWDYQTPYQLKEGFNIVNILYDPSTPDETGHYCLIHLNNENGKIIFFNPIASHSMDQKKHLWDLIKVFGEDNVFIDMSGKQSLNSSDCGYYCLTKAFNIYNNLQGGKLPENPTTKDYLADILRLLRALYYKKYIAPMNPKHSVSNEVRRMKSKSRTSDRGMRKDSQKMEGSGLSDDLPETRIKAFSFQELKNEVENN